MSSPIHGHEANKWEQCSFFRSKVYMGLHELRDEDPVRSIGNNGEETDPMGNERVPTAAQQIEEVRGKYNLKQEAKAAADREAIRRGATPSERHRLCDSKNQKDPSSSNSEVYFAFSRKKKSLTSS